MITRVARILAPLSALVASLVTWPAMPDPMPIHWGIDGRPDGFAPRAVGLLLLPAVAFALPLVIDLFASRDPKLGPNARRSVGVTLAATAAFLSALHGLILVACLGDGTLALGPFTALLGALFVVLGWAMRDIEPNGFIGVRTPTTLRDPAIWKVVHDKTSIAFVAAGLLSIVAALALPASVALGLAIVAILVTGLGSLAFAWSLGRARG